MTPQMNLNTANALLAYGNTANGFSAGPQSGRSVALDVRALTHSGLYIHYPTALVVWDRITIHHGFCQGSQSRFKGINPRHRLPNRLFRLGRKLLQVGAMLMQRLYV